MPGWGSYVKPKKTKAELRIEARREYGKRWLSDIDELQRITATARVKVKRLPPAPHPDDIAPVVVRDPDAARPAGPIYAGPAQRPGRGRQGRGRVQVPGRRVGRYNDGPRSADRDGPGGSGRIRARTDPRPHHRGPRPSRGGRREDGPPTKAEPDPARSRDRDEGRRQVTPRDWRRARSVSHDHMEAHGSDEPVGANQVKCRMPLVEGPV
jgi:hypothetical protein